MGKSIRKGFSSEHRLETIPTTLRLPESLHEELPYMAIFHFKTSVADLLRTWIVEKSRETMNDERYKKMKMEQEAET